MFMKAIANCLFSQIEPNEPVRLAKQLINAPSFQWQETDIADWVGDRTQGRGFEVQPPLHVDSSGIDHQTFDRLDGDSTDPSLMLDGHLDTTGWQGEPILTGA